MKKKLISYISMFMAMVLLVTSMPFTAAAEQQNAADRMKNRAQTAQTGEAAFVPGELLVCLKEKASPSNARKGLQSSSKTQLQGISGGLQWEALIGLEEQPAGQESGSSLTGTFTGAFSDNDPQEHTEKTIYLVKAAGCSTKEALEAQIEELEALPDVEYAELNQVYSVSSEDLTGRQWAYAENEELPQFADNVHMGVDDPAEPQLSNWNAYEDDGVTPDRIIQPEKQDMVVAVIDTGIDYNHPDLKDVMWDDGEAYSALVRLGGGKYGINTVAADSTGNPYSSADPMDDHSHGTHCAGIIGAQWNGEGVSGVVSGVKLMAVKIGHEKGLMRTSDMLKGFAYVAEAMRCGVNVVATNNSWGNNGVDGLAINDCVTELGRLGAVSCFASGNEDDNIDYRGSSVTLSQHNPYMVVVDAIDKDGHLADFSNYGKRMTDVAAPGVDIFSTIPLNKASLDALSDVLTPSVAVRGAALDTFETAETDEEGNILGTWFDYSGTLSPVIAETDGYRGGRALELGMKSQQEKDPDLKFVQMTSTFNIDGFSEAERPSEIATAVYVSGGTDKADVRGVYLELKDADGQQLSTRAVGYTRDIWLSVSVPVPETAHGNLLFTVQVYNMSFTEETIPDYTVYLDNILLSGKLTPYGYMSGTSMATPAVTGETAAVMAVNYDVLYSGMTAEEKSYRAMETAARIRGSVELMPLTKERELIGSGGYARLDYALHGYTQPVILSIEPETADGKDTVLLRGFYLNGYTGTDSEEQAEQDMGMIEAVLVDGQDVTDQILETDANGHWIRFTMPEGFNEGEHIFSVTANGRTGRECLFTGTSSKHFERYEMDDESRQTLAHTNGAGMSALKDRLYYIGISIGDPEIGDNRAFLWSAEIRNAGRSDQTVSEKWEKVADLGMDEEEASSLTACDGKLYITKSEEKGTITILRYTPESGTFEEKILKGLNVSEELCRLMYSQGHMMLVTYRTIRDADNEKTVTVVFELDPETLDVKNEQQFSSALPYWFHAIASEEKGRFLLVGGKEGGITGKTSVYELETEDGTISLNCLSEDLMGNLKERDDAKKTDFNMVPVKNGYVAAGPVLYGEDGQILSDAYAVNSDLTETVAFDRLFAETLMDGIQMTAYKGKVYLLANELESPEGLLFAGMDAGTVRPEGDYPIREPDPGTESGESGSDTGLPYYADRLGSWQKTLSSDGRELWSYRKSDGTPAVNEWVAIACTTWRTDQSWAYRWFRFDENGVMVTGWFTDVDGRGYYLNPTGGTELGAMVTGWQTIDGKEYYFKEESGGPKGALVPDAVR